MMQRLAAVVPFIQQRAAERDAQAAFPVEEVAMLREAGVLEVKLPVEGAGGCAAKDLATVLATVGRASLPLGRILEAHVNARHLIARYGTPEQCRAAADDAAAGHLFALWVTDPPDGGLRMTREGNAIRLDGGKMFCSAAGYATRALVTACTPEQTAQMLVLRLGEGETVSPLPAPLAGMRAASTGAVDFTGCLTDRDSALGQPGDYLQEPTFSAGAWRGSAVALGGLCAVVVVMQGQLRDAGRLDDPHQSARMGEALIARETARSWVGRVARIAERPDADPAAAVAAVGLGRLAVETACLEAMQLAQRSLGLAAFRQGNPMERLCRDLATYLRQPAPDMVLTEAAAWFGRQPVPAIVPVC
jgi:alkylation response protein AidB-like acyl-CoA dehydrogenase